MRETKTNEETTTNSSVRSMQKSSTVSLMVILDAFVCMCVHWCVRCKNYFILIAIKGTLYAIEPLAKITRVCPAVRCRPNLASERGDDGRRTTDDGRRCFDERRRRRRRKPFERCAPSDGDPARRRRRRRRRAVQRRLCLQETRAHRRGRESFKASRRRLRRRAGRGWIVETRCGRIRRKWWRGEGGRGRIDEWR